MTSKSSTTPCRHPLKELFTCAALLAILLGILFWRAFLPDYVVFSNDGPLGGMMSQHNRMPYILTGVWQDLNWLGSPYPQPLIEVTTLLRLVSEWVASPVLFAKILAPFSLFAVGMCAWFCFRQYKFSHLTCLLVAVAAALNSDFVGTSAWATSTLIISGSTSTSFVVLKMYLVLSARYSRPMLAPRA